MCEPAYWDIQADHVEPIVKDGYTIRVISGEVDGVVPKIQPKYVQARILDISLKKDHSLTLSMNMNDTLFIYTFNSQLKHMDKALPQKSAVLFDEGTKVTITALDDARFMWFEGEPLREPVAFGGPIVMNTRGELEHAFEELRRGTFIKHA